MNFAGSLVKFVFNMSKTIGLRYKTAREHLKLSKYAIKKNLKIDYSTISRIENDQADSPNWTYTKYLVESGINYFYLIGESEEIEGQKIDSVTRAEYETLQQSFDHLEKNYQELENRYNLLERVLQLLQIEIDEDGNVKQKK